VDVGNDSDSDTFAIILIVVLLVVLLLLIPLIAWMYVDVRQMELRVDKALKTLNK